MKAIIGIGSVGKEIAKLWPDALQFHHTILQRPLEINLNDIQQIIITVGYLDSVFLGKEEEGNWYQYEDIISANLTIPISLTQMFLQRSAVLESIVLIGSMAYRRILTGLSIYGAAKAGLAHFIKCAAFELAPKNIGIAGIFPTNIWETEISRQLIEKVGEQHYDASRRLPKKLTVQEVAVIATKLSDDLKVHKYLSGNIIELNGGERG